MQPAMLSRTRTRQDQACTPTTCSVPSVQSILREFAEVAIKVKVPCAVNATKLQTDYGHRTQPFEQVHGSVHSISKKKTAAIFGKYK